MRDMKEKRNLLRLFMALIPAVIITGLMILPNILVRTPTLTNIDYTITQQTQIEDSMSMQGTFSKDIQADETVWLYAEDAYITMEVQDHVFTFNNRVHTPTMFHSAGSGWFSFQSPMIQAGEPVSIKVQSYYGDHTYASEQLLDNLCVGDGSGLYHKALDQLDFFGMVLLFSVIAGIIFLVEGAIYYAMGMAKDGSRIVIFGFYCLAGALWCVSDAIYPYISLFITPAWLSAMLDKAGLLLFPIALATMILYFTRGKHTRNLIRLILITETLTALFSIGLQLFGIVDLGELQFIISTIAMISIGLALVCVALDLKHFRDRYLLLLFLTVLPVFICNMLEGMNILYPFMPRRTLMQYGFAISALLLVLQLVSYAKAELAKAKTLDQLETALEDSRITIMLSQIQPHFLYNSLAGIKQLTDSNPAKASEALEHFSYYLRHNLDSLVNKSLIPFQKEMEHVQDYLYLEKMRFPKKIKIELELNFYDFSLPPLSVQTIVENAVRYGITKKKGGGTLTIHSKKVDENAVIIVYDNGIGFHPSQSKEDGRTHTGIENVSNRLKLQCDGTLTVDSIQDVGTTVIITIPLKENAHEHNDSR